MTWGAVAGGVIAAGGSLLSAKASQPAAFKGKDTYSNLGYIDFTKKQVRSNLSPEQQAFYDQYGDIARQYLGGGGYGGQLAGIIGQDAASQIPGLFQGALDNSAVDYNSMLGYQQGMGSVLGGMGNLFGLTGQAGMEAMMGQAPGMDQSNFMFGAGANLFNQSQNYNDVFNQRLGLLREQAAPFESRAADSFLNRQYAMGRMGSTGGGRDVEAFARGLGQADTTRQLDAMNLSEALRGRDMTMGQGLMGMGTQGLQSGYNSRYGAIGDLFSRSGVLGGGTASMFGNVFQNQQGFNDLVNARAQQRMMNAANMFGFGSDINKANLQIGTGMSADQRNIVNSLLQTGQLGVAAAGGGQAGPQNPAGSALGAGLMGFGTTMMQNPSMFSGMFSKQPNLSMNNAQINAGMDAMMQNQLANIAQSYNGG